MILFKKAQDGTRTGIPSIYKDATTRAKELATYNIKPGAGVMVSDDLAKDNEILRQGYSALATGFKNKYKDLDDSYINQTIETVNPNFRPEWGPRADQFAEMMGKKYGDRYLTPQEQDSILSASKLIPTDFYKSRDVVANRLSETGVGLPYKGDKEVTAENWGWRQLGAPLHSVPAGADRYMGIFKKQ